MARLAPKGAPSLPEVLEGLKVVTLNLDSQVRKCDASHWENWMESLPPIPPEASCSTLKVGSRLFYKTWTEVRARLSVVQTLRDGLL